MSLPKIKTVRAWFTGGATAEKAAAGADYHDQAGGHWIDDHIATPMSKYPAYEQSRQSFGINVLGTLVVDRLRYLYRRRDGLLYRGKTSEPLY